MSVQSEVRELNRLLAMLRNSGNGQYKTHLRYVHDAVQKSARFRAVFDLLVAQTSGFDVDKWVQEKVFQARQTCHEWPTSEKHKLRVLHRIMEKCAVDDAVHPVGLGDKFEYNDNLDEKAQAVTRHIVSPLMAYLQASLEDASDVLYRLERMRRQIEWFDRDSLYDRFSADTSKGEAVYDRRVREFLFAEGIDYPFSKPRSASGEADVVANVETDHPLVCEIKLYDAVNYGIPRLRDGAAQALRYAHDYGKSAAHLVIFNLSDERLQLPSDEPAEVVPPRLQVENVTLYMVVVHAKPQPSASKDHRRHVRQVQRDQLVPPTDA